MGSDRDRELERKLAQSFVPQVVKEARKERDREERTAQRERLRAQREREIFERFEQERLSRHPNPAQYTRSAWSVITSSTAADCTV